MKRFTALIICIMLLLTGCASKIQSKELAVAEYPEKTEVYDLKTDPTGNAEFVKKLTSVVLDGDENQVISPANIYFALAMLAETANGNTRDQILDLLEKDDIAALRKNTPLLWKKLYKKDESGSKNYIGELKEFNEETITIDEVKIERKNISQIKTIYEWGN